jgi:hypothetical protein
MCLAVSFDWQAKKRTCHYKSMNAVLPVKARSGISLVPWGRRPHESGELPMGGWANYNDVLKGLWDKYIPKPVTLTVNQFLERDIEDNCHWHTLTRSQYIQGLLVQEGREVRVYVVTLVLPMLQTTFERWPRMLIDLNV